MSTPNEAVTDEEVGEVILILEARDLELPEFRAMQLKVAALIRKQAAQINLWRERYESEVAIRIEQAAQIAQLQKQIERGLRSKGMNTVTQDTTTNEESEAVIKAFYQARRLRFEGLFWGRLRETKKEESATFTLDELRAAWREACFQSESEFSSGAAELRGVVQNFYYECEE